MIDREAEARAFYAEHYSEKNDWEVVELQLTVFVPGMSPADALQLVEEILDEASFDIRVVPR